jgi:hypothetical protein
MSKIALTPNASGSGTFTIASPNSNTDRTLTLPDEAGTVLTSASSAGSVPTNSGTALFSAKFGSPEVWISVASGGIVPFDAEEFDTDGVFDTSSGNHQFTAPADGVYLFWWAIYSGENDSDNRFALFKNNAVLTLGLNDTGVLSFFQGTSDHVQSATVVLPLDSSDTIQVRAVASAADVYKGLSQWGGVRIS